MAELVERYIEEISESYSLLRRSELLDEDELRRIVKIHHGLLYKAARRQKRPNEFQALINLELQLWRIIRIRRKATGYIFTPELEKNLIQRVKQLHRAMCFRFPGQLAHWLQYLTFLESVSHFKAIDRVLSRLLQQHADKPEVWKAAGRWCFHGRVRLRMASRAKAARRREAGGRRVVDLHEPVVSEETERDADAQVRVLTMAEGVASGRRFFLKGVKANPGSAQLLVDYLAFEMEAADFARWREAEFDGKREAEARTDGSLAALVWATIKAKFGARRQVVEQCVRLVERVGWLRQEEWVQEMLQLYRSVEEEPQTSSPAAAKVASSLAEPQRQVAAFEERLKSDGPAGARLVWQEAAGGGWATVDLFKCYACLERAQVDLKARAEEVRMQCERMVALGGSQSPDFWMEYISLEREMDPARVGMLDWRARKTLCGGALAKFAAMTAARAFLA